VIVIIDNYDSFTYNLVQYIGEVHQSSRAPEVFRNDAVSIEELRAMPIRQIVISPGPCTPDEAGISMDVVREFYSSLPILGVCLGHQAIAQALGGRVIRAGQLLHGKTSKIHHDGKGVLAGLPPQFEATRYPSLAVDEASLPRLLEISARADDGEIMAIRHREYAHCNGLQFHPESILTEVGKKLLKKFLALR